MRLILALLVALSTVAAGGPLHYEITLLSTEGDLASCSVFNFLREPVELAGPVSVATFDTNAPATKAFTDNAKVLVTEVITPDGYTMVYGEITPIFVDGAHRRVAQACAWPGYRVRSYVARNYSPQVPLSNVLIVTLP